MDGDLKRIKIAGCPIDVIDKSGTLKYVEASIKQGWQSRHGFVNAGKIVQIQSNAELLEAISTCDLICADGMAVVWASRYLGSPLPERINGTNLMLDLVRLSHMKGYRLYMLGARPEVIEAAAKIFLADYPGIELVGWHHGYFSEEEESQIAASIRKLRADIVLVGMGTPQKEFWLKRNVPRIGAAFSMGVGGSFDVIAGVVKRAPTWAQDAGMEWFWRLLQEPRRMWRRYLIGNSYFIWLVARQKLRRMKGIDSD